MVVALLYHRLYGEIDRSRDPGISSCSDRVFLFAVPVPVYLCPSLQHEGTLVLKSLPLGGVPTCQDMMLDKARNFEAAVIRMLHI